ncbi:DM13 domain-containing protein [Gordonia humi]
MNIKSTAGIGLVAVALALGLAACGSDDSASNGDAAMSSAMSMSAMAQSDSSSMDGDSTTPTTGMADAETGGEFAGMNGKSVSGDVSIMGDTVTLSGFSSDEGPDLHLYLTDGTDEAAVGAGTEIGTVAFDKASQTFTLHGVDTSKYQNVVVHCDKAKAVFGAASLS